MLKLRQEDSKFQASLDYALRLTLKWLHSDIVYPTWLWILCNWRIRALVSPRTNIWYWEWLILNTVLLHSLACWARWLRTCLCDPMRDGDPPGPEPWVLCKRTYHKVSWVGQRENTWGRSLRVCFRAMGSFVPGHSSFLSLPLHTPQNLKFGWRLECVTQVPVFVGSPELRRWWRAELGLGPNFISTLLTSCLFSLAQSPLYSLRAR